MEKEPAGWRDVPLDVLALRTFLGVSRMGGGQMEMEQMHRILLDERESVAILGRRADRPVPWREARILLRSQGYLMTLTFLAREPAFPKLEPEFVRILRSLSVLTPGAFDPSVLGDIPVGPPGRAPRNIYAPSPPPPPPLLRSPGKQFDF